jgi:hypothetical protein
MDTGGEEQEVAAIFGVISHGVQRENETKVELE